MILMNEKMKEIVDQGIWIMIVSANERGDDRRELLSSNGLIGSLMLYWGLIQCKSRLNRLMKWHKNVGIFGIEDVINLSNDVANIKL